MCVEAVLIQYLEGWTGLMDGIDVAVQGASLFICGSSLDGMDTSEDYLEYSTLLIIGYGI